MKGLMFAFCRVVLVAACSIMGLAIVMIGIRLPPAGCLMLAYLAWKRLGSWHGSGYAFGTARWATMREVVGRGFLGRKGFIVGRTSYLAKPTLGQAIGRLFDPFCRSSMAYTLFSAVCLGTQPDREPIIRLQSGVHKAVFASTGSGKGVSIIIPNVLSHTGSLFVLDPQGEIYRATARRRRKRGHRVVLLDPYAICKDKADTFNPLDLIDANAPDFLEQCREIANSLVLRTGEEKEPHWPDSAEEILTSVISYVCACESNPQERTLDTVRLIVSSRQRLAESITWMKQVDGFGGVIRKKGDGLETYQGKELDSVLSTIQRHTSFLDSPPVVKATSSTSFDLEALREGKLTVYLCMPPNRLVLLSGLLRSWINAFLQLLVRDGVNESRPLLMILDEAGHLGKMQALENAVTSMRAYGLRLVFIFQSLGQVAKCFDAPTFLDNMETKIFFGTNSEESATAISRLGGDATQMIEQLNKTAGYSYSPNDGKETRNYSRSTSVTLSETKRPLMMPDEPLRLPRDFAIVFHSNMHPIPVRLLRYYDAPEFKRGGTGQSRGPGLFGVLATLCLACVCVLAAVAGVGLAEFIHQSQPMVVRRPSDFDDDDVAPLPARGRDFRYP